VHVRELRRKTLLRTRLSGIAPPRRAVCARRQSHARKPEIGLPSAQRAVRRARLWKRVHAFQADANARTDRQTRSRTCSSLIRSPRTGRDPSDDRHRGSGFARPCRARTPNEARFGAAAAEPCGCSDFTMRSLSLPPATPLSRTDARIRRYAVPAPQPVRAPERCSPLRQPDHANRSPHGPNAKALSPSSAAARKHGRRCDASTGDHHNVNSASCNRSRIAVRPCSPRKLPPCALNRVPVRLASMRSDC
jgi:hypothetical protein